MIICLSLSSIPKLRTPRMLIFSIRDMFANVSFLNSRGLEPRAHFSSEARAEQERVLRTRASRGREAPGESESSGWNLSSHTGFLPRWNARVGVGASPGLPAGDAEHKPEDPATVFTHRLPPPRRRGSRGALRPARFYAAGPEHAGKSEARCARAALGSGNLTAQEG